MSDDNHNAVQCSLSVEEWIFIGEYLIDGNASRAVRVAGYTGIHAYEAGYRMIRRPGVVAELKRANEAMRKQTGLSVEMVVNDIVNVLNADPRDLVEYLTGSCRYCHGIDHLYHRTRGEVIKARREFFSDPTNEDKEFPMQGGEGFNAYRDPNPDCPECVGMGIQYTRLRDTRTLSPEAAALYDGIEQTRHGVKIKLRSKDNARADAARFLGMNKETLDVTVTRKLEDYSDAELIRLMSEKKV